MPYYAAGDYYRGDYYRGDIFGFAKKALGKVAKVGLGFALGGPVGAIAAGLPGGAIARKLISAGAPLLGKGVPGSLAVAPFEAIANFGSGSQRLAVAPPAVTPPQLIGGPGPGPLFGGPLEAGMMGRHSRRMNVTNVRALRRAGRRVKGFLKLARSLGALPVGGGKGKKLFKRKRG